MRVKCITFDPNTRELSVSLDNTGSVDTEELSVKLMKYELTEAQQDFLNDLVRSLYTKAIAKLQLELFGSTKSTQ
jgi:hypothetical protein